jgi:hypothetical protein
MRFIIREQDYEQLVAAGRLRYRSGAHEHWRLTEAIDGFRVLRVDLDRRETTAASTTLMHLLLDPNGRPERLKLRHFAPANSHHESSDESADGSVDVDVLVDGSTLTVSRSRKDKVTQDEYILPPGFGLLMPSTVGLALFVWGSRGQGRAQAIELDQRRCYAPANTMLELDAMDKETLTVTGQLVAVRPYLIRRDGVNSTTWLDEIGLPMRLEAENGRQAIEDRYVRHNRLNSDRELD